MKKIGIVGITAEGGSLCYRTIVSEASKILGNYKHPEILLVNPPFYDILQAQNKKDWKTVAKICVTAIKKLASIGADFVIIPGNSIHFAYEQIQKVSPIPVISIVETTVDECAKNSFNKVAVLGVGFVMTDGLYQKPLEEKGIEYVVPSLSYQKIINKIIYEEIVLGNVKESSINTVVKIVNDLKSSGSDAVILGCTELPIIITKENSPLPFIDTTRLLAKKALERAING